MNILDPRFKYTPAAHTNVRKTWLRAGWIPPNPAEQRKKKQALNRRVQ